MASESMTPGRPDVYVGPRPFRTGEHLFGRAQEVTTLTSLLIGERVVLLYSPSGAGKSSLIQAGLVPRLRRKPFHVPALAGEAGPGAPPVVVRVNTPLPKDLTAANRYVLSALLSLEEHRAQGERRAAADLAGTALEEYLKEEFPTAARAAGDGTVARQFRPTVLLFDQFEEVLTLDPIDVDAKEKFFEQLGATLADRGRWVLFSIREDHLAALDPYLPLLPNRLAARYRLDRLGRDAALEAIVEPAHAAGVEFDRQAAEELVTNLQQVRVQQPDNRFENRPWPYVEPVHLQIVCKSLWDMERANPKQITAGDVHKLAGETGLVGVDGVLAGYYAGRVVEGAREGHVSERRIRDWFEKQLITALRTRKPVLRGEEAAFGVNAPCLKVLDKAYLIREEVRSGATWYELAHDRLIDPVLQDNSRWRAKHLNTFQKQASLWAETPGNPADLLAHGDLLTEGERWAEAHRGELTEEEQRFLKASQDARAARLREQEQERLRVQAERNTAQAAAREKEVKIRELKVMAIASFLAALVLGGLLYYAISQRNKAEASKKNALESEAKALNSEKNARQSELKARDSEAKAKVNEAKARDSEAKFLDTVDQMLMQVGSVDLADVPQMERVREELLQKARDGLLAFLKDRGDDPAVRNLLGRTHVLLGEILSMLGKRRDAKSEYDQGLELLPREPGNQRDLARCYKDRGLWFKESNRFPEAEEDLRKALRLRQQLVNQFPRNADYQRELRETRYYLVALLARLRQLDQQVEDDYRQTLKEQEKLANDYADRLDYRADLARTHNNLGIYLQRSNSKEAEQHFRDAIGIYEQLRQKAADVSAYRWGLARSQSNLGRLLKESGALKQAEAAYRKAQELFAKLARNFPRVPDYRQELVTVHRNLGELLLKEDLTSEAQAEFKDALSVAKKLADDFPDRPDYRRNLADMYDSWAGFLEKRHRLQEAVSFYEQALVIRGDLVEEFYEVEEYKSDRGGTLYNLALLLFNWTQRTEPGEGFSLNLLLRFAVLVEARNYFKKAADSQRAAWKATKNPDYRKELLMSYESLADAELKLGNINQAAAAAEELPQISPDDSDQYVRAAELLSGCVSLASMAKREDLVERYGSRAVHSLQQAVEKGFKNVEEIKTNPLYYPLRERDDFKKLLRYLENTTRKAVG
jgi:tetratricopeptide (TPR) repeat protein